jgi:hypothetical protein
MVDAGITTAQAIVNTAEISDGLGNITQIQAITFVNGYSLLLPQVNFYFAP